MSHHFRRGASIERKRERRADMMAIDYCTMYQKSPVENEIEMVNVNGESDDRGEK